MLSNSEACICFILILASFGRGAFVRRRAHPRHLGLSGTCRFIHSRFLTKVYAPPTSASSTGRDAFRSLYPGSTAFRNGTIQVDSIHTLYYEEHGRGPLRALFLHGGPGAGCSPRHARFFDPSQYRIVLLDQRGCGKSTPAGEIRNNTLEHLVLDCERLRQRLGVERWDVVLGGSWGATLALAYAQMFSDSVRSLVLRGVCLMRTVEIDWLFSNRNGTVSTMFPEDWEVFANHSGSQEIAPREALHRYYDYLLGRDPLSRILATRSWMGWEHSVFARSSTQSSQTGGRTVVAVYQNDEWCVRRPDGNHFSPEETLELRLNDIVGLVERRRKGLHKLVNDTHSYPVFSTTWRPIHPREPLTPPNETESTMLENAQSFIPAQAMLTNFFSVNDRYCMNNKDLLSNMWSIGHIHCIAIHGGDDLICPIDNALDLKNAYPSMELVVPLKAGHSMYDPAVASELVRATDRFALKFCGRSNK